MYSFLLPVNKSSLLLITASLQKVILKLLVTFKICKAVFLENYKGLSSLKKAT